MKQTIAVPVAGGIACAHFGHCEQFAFIDVDNSTIGTIRYLTPPTHQPGSHPKFIADEGATVVLAGGMGFKAQQMLEAAGITVCLGVAEQDPETLVRQYLDGSLSPGANQCDH